ncbi:hypothetical protein V8J88_18945 [Massilia sp. W12]|uniref:hypothetical protein n=1 Tax=Massilia sp. W12 TaxID=3126507 RepID=UPI0030CB96BC
MKLCLAMLFVGLCSTNLALQAMAKRQLALRSEQRLPVVSAQLMLNQIASALSFVLLGALYQYAQAAAFIGFVLAIGVCLSMYALRATSPWQLLAAERDGHSAPGRAE